MRSGLAMGSILPKNKRGEYAATGSRFSINLKPGGKTRSHVVVSRLTSQPKVGNNPHIETRLSPRSSLVATYIVKIGDFQ